MDRKIELKIYFKTISYHNITMTKSNKFFSFIINNNILHIIDNDDPDLISKTIEYNINKINIKNGTYILKIIEDGFEDSDYKISKIMITNDLYLDEKLNYKPKFLLNINTGICMLFSKLELFSIKHFINNVVNKINSNLYLHNDYFACNVPNGIYSVNTCDNVHNESIGISISFINQIQ